MFFWYSNCQVKTCISQCLLTSNFLLPDQASLIPGGSRGTGQSWGGSTCSLFRWSLQIKKDFMGRKGRGRGEDFSACFWRAVYLLMCRCTVITHSLGLSAVTINCTTLLFLFSLGVKGMERIKSFSLTQSIPLSEDRVLRLGRCSWTCAPDYWLVRHPMLSWFGGLGVYLCPPGVTETKSCKLHQPFVRGLL